ncbi:peptide synthetase, partial [Aureobasidium melanogenum]
LEGKHKLSSTAVPVKDLSPSSVSYVLYTSGTTGTPKGCELTHDNAVQLVMAFKRLFKGRWTDESRWLQFASYHFDVSVLEQFWTWIVGMRLVCAPRDLILEDIAGFIDTMHITHLDLTPSLGRLLDPALVPSLHKGVFITGGEALKQDQINTWGDVGCLFNFYGPTECTIGVTVFPSVPKEGKPSNIGWQFDNVGSYVLAPGSQTPVLRGAVGELCISGKLVGKGYLNRPELTADCFPYLDAFGERVYRTGDLVRLFHDGSIDFLGRKDNQVKLRGQRLEIDEIEAVIKG